MSFPVIALASFKATDAFKADPSALTKAVGATTRAAPGTTGIAAAGVQHEDGATGYFVTVWETPEAAAEHAATAKGLLGLAGDVETVARVQARSDPGAALGAPVTELVQLRLQAGKSRAEFEAGMRELAEKMAGAPSGLGVRGWVWGPKEGDEGAYVLLVGWETIEAHYEARQAMTPPAVLVDFATVESVVHAPLVSV